MEKNLNQQNVTTNADVPRAPPEAHQKAGAQPSQSFYVKKSFTYDQIISSEKIEALQTALLKRSIVVCFGSGVDSTAMLVALHVARIRPDAITFADTGAEKPETYAHVVKMIKLIKLWGWPLIDVCKKMTLAKTNYSDLYGNCLSNETLPSFAFGMKSCSIKWKQNPQDQFLKGSKSGPPSEGPIKRPLESRIFPLIRLAA